MGIFIYAVVMIVFLIPISFRALQSLKQGRFPLPYFQNNIVANRIKVREALGVVSPILFWTIRAVFAIGSFAVGAWIAASAAIAYMVISAMLSAQIISKAIRVSPGTSLAIPGKFVRQ